MCECVCVSVCVSVCRVTMEPKVNSDVSILLESRL